ncbi:MAG: hypothetical protein JO069_06280 [Verrucomicrobia bacterium]|nr:hypothetical protein [Verrucomicrobiota bacterium]
MTGVTALLALAWALALATSPDLHERIHPDANHEGHDCGAMLFLSGAVGPALLVLACFVGKPRLPLVRLAVLTRPAVWTVRPIDRAVLEHAPPRPTRRLTEAI